MWHFARKTSHSQVEHAVTMLGLLQATISQLVVISAAFWLVCALVLSSNWEGVRLLGLMAAIFGVGLVFALAYRMVQRHYLLALALWLAGMVLAILSSSRLLQDPLMVLLGSVLPLIAVITVGGWAGVATEVVLVGLVWVVTQASFGGSLTNGEALLVIGVGAFAGLLGWSASRELLAAAEWSMSSFDKAQKALVEVREERLELEQSRADLIQANRELARLSTRLKVLEQIAEEARQAKTEFVANVSHELRTPLNMIIGFADIISRSPHVYGGRLPPSLLTDIAAIRRNAEHLATLVNDVLDLSQVEAGRMALSRDWVSISPVITEALAVVAGLFASRGLYLQAEITPDLPPVFCDSTRIRQVIINLLGNAGRFTERGGVVLACQPLGHEIVISVADTGPGIAEKDQMRIFEPFQQADVSTRRKHGGSGLGLTISKQFVEMHGGSLWLESTVGVGTTIRFSLPLANSPTLPVDRGHSLRRAIVADDEVGYHLRARPSHQPPPAVTERLVVVDPQQTLQRLLSRYLPGVEVEAAPDLESALMALTRSPAQALVVNDPPGQASSLAALGSLPFGTPAITCWLPGEHEAARRLGVVEYLVKPLAQEKLLATLRQLGPGVKTVLIVNDEEDELQLFARMLAADERRYSILQVTTGPRALSMLRSRRADVMLLDLNMPGMNGFQVLEEKLADASIADIPVIIISSRDPAGDPIFSNTLTVTHRPGFSQRNLVDCIQAIGAILAPLSVVEHSR